MEMTSVDDLCRICCTFTSGMVRHFIFEKAETNKNLSNKISLCLPLEIAADDYLPKYVCGECVYKLDMVFEFRTLSVKTDEYLRSIIENKVGEEPGEYFHSVTSNDNCSYNSSDEKLSLKLSRKKCSSDDSEDNQGIQLMRQGEEEEVVTNFDHFMSSKSIADANHPENDNGDGNTEVSKKAIAEKETVVPVQRRMRPIRAVRLQSDISYKSDSILESLLKKPSSHGNKKAKKISAKSKKTILRQCKFCMIVLPSKEYYSHITEEHKKQFECGVCKCRFANVEELEEHKEQVDHTSAEKDDEMSRGVTLLKCNQCQKTYLRKHLLVLHMRRHTGERPFPCNLCDRKYACKSSLNSHLLKHKQEWKHVCNFCGKGFVDKHSFVYHVRSNHTGERPFACHKCDKRFIKKQDLIKHEQTQHSEMPKQLFSCEKCGRICKDYDALRSHRRSHIPLEARRVHKCNLCDASFTGKTGLMKHMHRHTGEMPYECEQCSKRFFTKKGLDLHLVIHSGVKSFICEYCGRAFSQDNTLRVHRRTHTGERPYECNICTKRFTQSSALNSHRKLHLKDN